MILLVLSLTLGCAVFLTLELPPFVPLAGGEGLKLLRPVSQQITVGEGAVIDLYGDSFDADVTAHLVMNVSAQRGELFSYPVEGVFNSSLLVDDILYLGSAQNGLLAINVANPLEPRLLGEYLTGLPIVDIQQKAGFLYLACGQAGVAIMEMEPSGELVAVVDVPVNLLALDICFVGELIVVAAGADGLLLYTFNADQELVLTERIDVGARVIALESSGNFLYLLTQNKTLEVFFFAEGNPIHSSSIELSATPKDLSLFHESLFVASSDHLGRFDLTVPGTPQSAGVIDNFGSADKIIYGEKNLYVIDSFTRLSIIDPDVLEIVKTIDFTTHIRTLTEAGPFLFVAGAKTGLQVFERDLADIQSAVQVMNTAGSSHDLVVIDDWIYVADKRGGVVLKNLQHDQGFLTLVSPRNAESFCLDEQRKLLFVALGRSGIEVIDVRDPGQPRTVALWAELQASKMTVSGDNLIVSSGVYGMTLVNTSQLNNPVVKQIYPELHALDLYAAKDTLYVASNRQGLQIYSITADQLQLLSETALPFPMNQFAHTVAVSVVDDVACVANGRSGLMLVAVRNPEKTEILGLIDIPGFAKSISNDSGKAFVSSQGGGVTVVNIDNPHTPQIESHIPLNGISRGLQVVDGLIYVSQLNAGIMAIPVPLTAARIDVQSANHVRIGFPPSQFAGKYGLYVATRTDASFFDDIVTVDENR